MRYSADLSQVAVGKYPAPFAIKDGAVPVGYAIDTRLMSPPRAEIRKTTDGQGLYTDNKRFLSIGLASEATSIDLHTWLAADLELFDGSGASIFKTKLPASPAGAIFAVPGKTIANIQLKAVSEFMLLVLGVEV